MNIVIYVALFVAIALLVYSLKDRVKNKAIGIRNNYKNKINAKVEKDAQFQRVYGDLENKSLIYKIDRLLLTSGLKRRFPKISAGIFLFILVVSALIGFIASIVIAKNIFISLFVAAALVVIEVAIVKALAAKAYNEIEDGTEIFVSLLCNHAKGSTDLVTIFEGAYMSLDGELRRLVETFINNAKRLGNVDMALDLMKESIDNKQLRTIIVNLKNCSHFRANYEEVLSQMMSQIAESLTSREERKNVLFSMKVTLMVISVASLIIVEIVGAGLDIEVFEILTSNSFGQGLMFMTGILYLFVLTRLFKTDR